jgi:hypothetical protein
MREVVMGEEQKILRGLLLEERKLREAYVRFLPLLQPPFLQEKVRAWLGAGEKHIQRLEEALDEIGDPEGKKIVSVPPEPAAFSTHILLQYFYESEERLYYFYMGASRQEAEGILRPLFEAHLQDQRKHLAEIQKIYTDSLYY